MFEKGRIVTLDGRLGVVVLVGEELDEDMGDHTGVWFGDVEGGRPVVFTVPTEYLAAGPRPVMEH